MAMGDGGRGIQGSARTWPGRGVVGTEGPKRVRPEAADLASGRGGPTRADASKQERGEGAGPLVHDPIICREPGRPPPEQGTNQGGTLPETNPGDGLEPRAAFGDERDLLSPN